jgi:integrase
VLFRLLATTGMRLSEAFEIDGELKERGFRYVIVGKKTEQSLRRVPLPAGVLAHLPKSIKGRLFEGDAPAASKRLNRFLNQHGVRERRRGRGANLDYCNSDGRRLSCEFRRRFWGDRKRHWKAYRRKNRDIFVAQHDIRMPWYLRSFHSVREGHCNVVL